MNNEILWHGVEIVTCLFETIVYYMFLKDFLGGNSSKGTYKIFGFGIFFVILTLITFFMPYPTITLLFGISGIFILSFLFNGDIKTKIFATILLIAFLIASEMITMFGILVFDKTSTELALKSGAPRLLGIIISKMVLLIITKSVCMFKQRKNSKVPILYLLAMLSISATTIISMYVIIMINVKEGNTDLSYISFAASIGLLYSNIMVFYLFEVILEKFEIQTHNKLLKQQMEFQLDYYDNLIISKNEMRSLRHDIKNHFICISEFIQKHDITKALNYIKTVFAIVENSKNEIATGNPVIDSLLNAKINRAKSENIEVNCIIEIPSGVKIEHVDTCVIFGNALDNAIEACGRLKRGNKKINIVLSYSNNNIVCKITNTTNGNVLKRGNRFITSKADSEYHGLGLNNIERSVKKYNGALELEHTDDTFVLMFILNNV